MEDTKFSGTITIPRTDPISVAKKHLQVVAPEFVVYFLVSLLLRARYGGLVSTNFPV
jgi:hypothetical protein